MMTQAGVTTVAANAAVNGSSWSYSATEDLHLSEQVTVKSLGCQNDFCIQSNSEDIS